MARSATPSNIREIVRNGKTYYEARFTNATTGKRHSICARTRRECEQRLRAAMLAAASGKLVQRDNVGVSEWVERWINGRLDLTPGTVQLYKRYHGCYVKPYFEGFKLQKLNRGHCQGFIEFLAEGSDTHSPLKPSTVRTVTSMLKAALTEAVKRDMIPANPATGLLMPRVEKVKPKVLDTKTQRVFIDDCDESKYGKFFRVLLYTGLRISEGLGLRWENVDLDGKMLTIDGQLSRDSERKIIPTKSHKERLVPLPDHLCELLREIRRDQLRAKLQAGAEWSNEYGFVFTNKYGAPLCHSTVSKAFSNLCKKHGIDATPHTLRHTDVTNRLCAGDDLKTVSTIAGHASISITADVYAGVTNDMLMKSAERAQEAWLKNHA